MLTDSTLGLVPGEFILFAVVLAGIALLQRYTPPEIEEAIR